MQCTQLWELTVYCIVVQVRVELDRVHVDKLPCIVDCAACWLYSAPVSISAALHSMTAA